MDIVEDVEKIIKLHDKIIEKTGGANGIIDKGLLEASLKRPFCGLSNGTQFYPTVLDKAACLIQSIIINHPFVDGNKRTAFELLLLFLKEKGYELKYEDEDEVITLCLNIATKKLKINDIKEWLNKRVIMTK